MPLDPSIIMQASAKPFDAAGAVQGAYKLKNLVDESRLANLKSDNERVKLEGHRTLTSLLPTLSDPFGKDAPTLAKAMAPYDLDGSVKFLTGTHQNAKASSDADKAQVEAGLAKADAVARTVHGIRQLPPEQRAAAYQRAIPSLEGLGLTPPAQWDEGVADQQLALAMSVKEQLEQARADRVEERQATSLADLIRHRGVVEEQGAQRIAQTGAHQGVIEAQGWERVSKPERVGTVESVLAKVARNEALTPGEVKVLEFSKSGNGRRGGARGGFTYAGPVARQAPQAQQLDANGNVPNPAGPNTQPGSVQARRQQSPRSGGQTSGGRYKLPAGYTPARFVQEARQAVANGADRAQVAARLKAAGLNPSALGR